MFKKVLSTVLVMAMMVGMGSTVMAGEVEKDYVVTYQAEEITDIDELIDMAITQPATFSTDGAEEDLSVEQLLEVREYKDGTVEKDYITSAFAMVDENNKKIKMNNSNIQAYNLDTTTGGGGSVAVMQTLSYTHKWYDVNKSLYHINYNTARVFGKNQNDRVSITSWYTYDYSFLEQYGPYFTLLTNYADVNRDYTKHYNLDIITLEALTGAGVGMEFTVNNSFTFDTSIICATTP